MIFRFAALGLALAALLPGQWLGYPSKGVPRLKNGKPNLAAPIVRTREGKIDLSGVWETYNEGGGMPVLLLNAAAEAKPGDVVFQPWAEAEFKKRMESQGKDHPGAKCLPSIFPEKNAVPHPFKIVQTPDLTLVLYESRTIYRQIFTDGRKPPADPVPAWQGYSVGHFEKNAFVVETSGFHGDGWLDMAGHPSTEALKITERFVPKDYGHMDIVTTIDDPKTYMKPWTMTLHATRLVDTDVIEYICEENNTDLPHMVGK